MKKLILLMLFFANLTVFAQKEDSKPVNFDYMPRINEVAVKGNVSQKFTAYKHGNPVYFIVVKKMNVHLWDINLYNKLNVGDKVELVGIVPLSWQPDRTTPVPDQIPRNIVAKQN